MAAFSIDVGLVLFGFIVALYATHAFAKAGRDWEGMRGDLMRLSQQVEAYYMLSRNASERVSQLDPQAGAPKTVLTSMRDTVAEDTENVRPDMTAGEARKIRERWS